MLRRSRAPVLRKNGGESFVSVRNQKRGTALNCEADHRFSDKRNKSSEGMRVTDAVAHQALQNSRTVPSLESPAEVSVATRANLFGCETAMAGWSSSVGAFLLAGGGRVLGDMRDACSTRCVDFDSRRRICAGTWGITEAVGDAWASPITVEVG